MDFEVKKGKNKYWNGFIIKNCNLRRLEWKIRQKLE